MTVIVHAKMHVSFICMATFPPAQFGIAINKLNRFCPLKYYFYLCITNQILFSQFVFNLSIMGDKFAYFVFFIIQCIVIQANVLPANQGK